MNVKRTAEKEIAFLAALAATGNVTKAAVAAGLGRMTVYEWREADEDFAAKWERSLKIAADMLEDHAVERASEGWEEPVFHLGVATDTVRKYSDTLLIFLLKGAKPDKFRENSKVELSGNLNVNAMTDEEIAAELAGLAAAGVLSVVEEPEDASDLV